MVRDLTTFFNPKSVAVVGASRSPEKVGAIVLKNIIESGFGGEIYPVNPEAQEIYGRKCYTDIASIPAAPDLAAVALPPQLALEVLQQLGEKRVKNVVVFTAGFKEVGPEGEGLEKKLVEMASRYQLNVLGPNCLGFVNNFCPINVTFGQVVKKTGNIRFITQSGAIAASLFDWCESTGAGFAEFVTLGNKAVLNENDILRYWQGQTNFPTLPDRPRLSDHSPIGLYLEQIANGREFLDLATAMSARDPIFILKPGRSKAAAKAMLSHTGAIAGEDAVLEAALKQAGVIRAGGLEDFFDLARSLAWENPLTGPKIAVVSNAGGPAVTIADAVSEQGLELADFSTETHRKLDEKLPRSSSILNPVDVLGDALAQRFAEAIEIVLSENDVNGLLVILTPQVMTQIERTAEVIGRASEKYRKPIMCSFIGGVHVAAGEEILDRYKIPSFHFPERAVAAMAASWRWQKWQERSRVQGGQTVGAVLGEVKEISERARQEGRVALDAFEAQGVLAGAGVVVPAAQKVGTVEETEKFAGDFGFPVVLKLFSSELVHKSDAGGVVIGIKDRLQLASAWAGLMEKIKQLEEKGQKGIGVMVQKQITDGVEVVVGVKKDQTFGLTMMFGAGGTLAELVADRNLHLLPVGVEEVGEMVKSSKVYPLLSGYRSSSPLAIGKLTDLMVRMGKLAEGLPGAAEMEANPVIVTRENAWAVDARIILEEHA